MVLLPRWCHGTFVTCLSVPVFELNVTYIKNFSWYTGVLLSSVLRTLLRCSIEGEGRERGVLRWYLERVAGDLGTLHVLSSYLDVGVES